MNTPSDAVDWRARLRLVAPHTGNRLPWTLTLGAAALLILHPLPLPAVIRLIDWPTLGGLAGLLVLTEGIKCSGALQGTAQRLLVRVTGLRKLGLLLAALSAVLSAVITNDVCLFLLVPLTGVLAQRAHLPLARLVALEAVAVNAGSALTPIGNPQNLFLWQHSGMDFIHFTGMMVAPVAVMLGLLLPATWLLLPSGAVSLREAGPSPPVHRALLWSAGGLFPLFVAALDLHLLPVALTLVAAVFVLRFRGVLWRVDWSLLIIVALMFVDMRQLASLPALSAWLGSLPIGQGRRAFLASVLASQAVSNVPAAILLFPYVHDLPALAAGVSVGGFGLFIGSLANLIALRLSGARRGLAVLHAVSIPFLLISCTLIALLFRG